MSGNSNYKPVANSDTVATSEDARLVISAAQLLANDTDRNNDRLRITSVGGGNNCSVSIDCNGNIVIEPKANFSGAASFSYTISDGKGGTSTATVFVNVAAVADAASLSVSNASGNEDGAISLCINAALKDTDSSESLKVVIGGVPSGASLSAGTRNSDGTWTLTQSQLSGLKVTPPANSDADFDLTVRAITTEASNGSSAQTVKTLRVTVNAVADAPALVVTEATGSADSAIALSINAGLTDTDGSESLKVVISGVPAGATLNHGTHNADGTWTLTSAQLAGLTITPPTNSDADFNLTIKAMSTESSNGSTANTQQTLHVVVNPSAPVLTVQDVVGNEDSAIALNISVNGPDTTPVTINGVPAGAVLNHGTQNADGSWTLTKAQLVGLTITPAHDSDGDFNLSVSVGSGSTGGDDDHDDDHHDHRHGNEGLGNGDDAPPPGHSYNWNDGDGSSRGNPGRCGGGRDDDDERDDDDRGGSRGRGRDDDDHDDDHGDDHDDHHGQGGHHDHDDHDHHDDDDDHTGGTTVTQTIHVTVNAVADLPTLSVAAASGNAGAPIALNIASALADTDGSESLSIRVSGLPAGATLSAGQLNSDGSYTLSPAQLAGLTLTAPSGANGDFNLIVAATSTESGPAAAGQSQSTNTATIALHLTGGVQQIVANNDTASLQEDVSPAASGNVLSNDNDPNAGGVLAVANPGNYIGEFGTLVLAANGSYTYTLHNGAPNVQSLAAGQQVTDTFTYQAADQLGAASGSASLKITITGTNDAPEVNGEVIGDVLEGGAAVTVNALTYASDVDSGNTLSVVGVPASLPAGVSYNPTTHTFTFDPTVGAYNHMAAGATQTVTVNYGVSDGTATTAASAVFTITGTNDAPVVSGAVSGSGTEDGAPVVVNALANASDVDDGAVLSVVNVPVSLPAGVTYDSASHSFTLDPSVAAYQHLAKNATLSFTVAYGVSDGTSTTAASVTFTVTGTNDGPTVGAIVSGTVSEDAPTQSFNLLAGAGDVDDGHVLHASTISGLPAGVTQVGDHLVVDPSNAAFQHIAQGQQQVLTFNYLITDEFGASVSQTVSITVAGTNDAPTVSGMVTASANEGTSGHLVSLLTGAGDVDDGSTLHVSTITGLPAGIVQAGNFLVVDSSNAAFKHLAQGDSQVITVNYSVIDEFGGSVAQSAQITITGVNNAPTVSTIVIGAATDGGAVQTIDLLANASDVDDHHTLHVSTIAGLPAGVTQVGNSLVVDPTNPAFAHLAEGATEYLVFEYDVIDEFGASAHQSVVISIAGTNQAPTVSGFVTGAATEDGGEQFVNLLAGASDVDDGHTLHASVIAPQDLPAGVVQAGDTLVVDPSNAAFQNLAAGEQRVLIVNYSIVDEQGAAVPQSAKITVTGTNDAPTVSVAVTGAAIEGGPVQVVDLLAGASDIDHNAVLHAEIVGDLPAGMTLVGNTLHVDASDPAYQSLAQGEQQFITVHYNVVDEQGASVAQTAIITVTGANQAPAAVAETYTAAEDTPLIVSVAQGVLANDTDSDGDLLSAVLVTGPAHGTLTLNADGSFSYLANANYNGPDSFTYRANDGLQNSAPVTVSINVTPENDAPTAQDATITTTEDSPLQTLDVVSLMSANDIDVGDVVSVQSVSLLAGNLAFQDNGNGTISFDPNQYNSLSAIEHGVSDLLVTFVDGSGATVTRTLRVDVAGVNDTPLAHDATVGTDQNAPIQTLQLASLMGAQDVDGNDNLLVQSVVLNGVTLLDAQGNTITDPQAISALAHFTYTDNHDGTITFNPGQYKALPQYSVSNLWTAEAQFTVTFTDGRGGFVTQVLTVDVDGRNDAIIAQNGFYATTEDDPIVNRLDLVASLNASDPDFGDTVQIHSINRISGNLNFHINGDDTIGFDPDQYNYLSQGQHSVSQINVTFEDSSHQLVTRTLTVDFLGINDAPVAVADSYSVASGMALSVDGSGVLANDSDVDGTAVFTFIVQGPAHGEVTLATDGTFIYVATPGYEGLDSFTYQVFDGHDYSAETAVNITVTPANFAALIGGFDTGSVQEDGALTASGFLTISDPNSVTNPAEATFTAGLYQGSFGILTLDQAGNWSFDLDNVSAQMLSAGQTVEDVITITSFDGTTHDITITVDGANDAPVAIDDNVILPAGVSSDIAIATLLDNDFDIDSNDTIAYVPGSVSVDIGTISEDGLGNLVYTPPANYVGAAVVTYRIIDSNGVETEGTARLSVGVNHEPIVVNDSLETIDGSTATIDVRANDSDPDGDTLTLISAGAAQHGDVVLNPDGTISYTPTDGNHHDSFQYTVVDSHGAESTATVSVFNNANPGAGDDEGYSTDEETEVGIDPATLLANDEDGNGDTLSITSVAETSSNGGTVTFAGDTVYYTPPTDFNGTDFFQYTVSDGFGGESVATVAVVVNPVNDAPSAAGGVLFVDEDVAGFGTLAASDPEFDAIQFSLSTVSGAAPQHGTVDINSDGTYTYTPNADFSGIDGFWFTADDGNGGTADNYVTVQITAKADAPDLETPPSGPTAGDEFLVSSGLAGAFSLTPSVATFSSGQFLTVWVELDAAARTGNVVGQRFAADGSQLGGQFVVTNAATDELNTDVRVLALSNDGYVVTWTRHDVANGGNVTDVFAQRYDALDQAVGTTFQVNSDIDGTLFEDRQALAATADGGFLVSWNTYDDATETATIEARLYDAAGTGGAQINLTSSVGEDARIYSPAVAMFDDGSFIEAWQAINPDNGAYDIFAKIFNADGSVKVGTFVVSTDTSGNTDYTPSVAVLEGGDAIIVWGRDGGQNGTDDIVAQRLDGLGQTVGDWFTVSTDQGSGEVDFNPVVVARPGGGFVVTYDTYQQVGSSFDISAQLYGASGARSGNEFVVSVDAVNGYDDHSASTAITAEGGFVVAWDSLDTTNGSTDITARVYGPGEGLSGLEDTPLALTPLVAALTDIDGSETLSVTISGLPTGAVLNAGMQISASTWYFAGADLAALATLTFTAPADQHGSFTLVAIAEARESTNGDTATTTSSFTFNIDGVNDAPVVESGESNILSGASLSGNLVASDIDDTELVYGLVSGSEPQHGQVVIAPDSGAFTYVSDLGYLGEDSFTYSVYDRHAGGLTTATYTLHVLPTVAGDETDNLLSGSAINDVIVGGLGNDTMTGGDGTDVFVFGMGANDGNDTILDFDSLADILQFRDVLGTPGDDVAAIDALLGGITDNGAGGTIANFTNGASIDFSSIGFASQTSISELLLDSAAQLQVVYA
jgi:VCBS repeat-containing protein